MYMNRAERVRYMKYLLRKFNCPIYRYKTKSGKYIEIGYVPHLWKPHKQRQNKALKAYANNDKHA
jgi:hypothetical protein